MSDQNASVLGAIDRPKVVDGRMTCPRCQRKILVDRALSPSGWKPAPKGQQNCS